MADLSATQRLALIDSLIEWLRENVGDEHNDVELQLYHGIESDYREDLVEPELSRNGTATLTVRINGGKRHSQLA